MLRFGAHYALRNVLRTPLRSALTLISIALVISLYVLLTAIAHSFADQMRNLMEQDGVDVVVQSKYSTNPMSSSLTPAQVEQIQSMPGVRSQEPIVLGRKRLPNRDMVYLFGIDDLSRLTDKLGISLTTGRLYRLGSQEVVVAQRVLKILESDAPTELSFPGEDALKVVGGFRSWISFFNSSVICDLGCARRLLDRDNKTNMLFLTLDNPADAETMMARINKDHPDLLAIKAGEFSGSGMLKNLFYLSDIVALVTLLIALAIVVNTFLIKVHERVAEIGILHAIGWHRLSVVYTLTVESLILTLTGGALGFVLSMALLGYINSAYQQMRVLLPQHLDAGLFGYNLMVCTAIAVISVAIPAYKAARINVVCALDGK